MISIPQSWKKKTVNWLEKNRGVVILFFCLPASLIFDFILRLRIWLERKFTFVHGAHRERVSEIQSQVILRAKLHALFLFL